MVVIGLSFASGSRMIDWWSGILSSMARVVPFQFYEFGGVSRLVTQGQVVCSVRGS